uniref:Uncharacterized protein n=1 Tax=Strongyloides venezuelensis TaxID=75913 RepID=A0A0K0G0P2_STRVS
MYCKRNTNYFSQSLPMVFSRKSACLSEISSIPSPIRMEDSFTIGNDPEQTPIVGGNNRNFFDYKMPVSNSENHELNISFVERFSSQESSFLSSGELRRPMLPGKESESFVTSDTSTEADEHMSEEFSIDALPIFKNEFPSNPQTKPQFYNTITNHRVDSCLATQKIRCNDSNNVVVDAINNDIKVISSLLYEGGYRRWSLDGFDLSNIDINSEIWKRKMTQCRTDVINEFEKDQRETIYLLHFKQFIKRYSQLDNAQKAMSELEKFEELHSLVNRARNMWLQQLLFNIAKISKVEFEKFTEKALNFDFIGIDRQSLMNCISLIERDYNVVDRLNTSPPEDMKNTSYLGLSLDASFFQLNNQTIGRELLSDIKKHGFDAMYADGQAVKSKNNVPPFEKKTSTGKKKNRRLVGLFQRVIKLFRRKQ